MTCSSSSCKVASAHARLDNSWGKKPLALRAQLQKLTARASSQTFSRAQAQAVFARSLARNSLSFAFAAWLRASKSGAWPRRARAQAVFTNSCTG